MDSPPIPSDRDLVSSAHPYNGGYNWLANRQIGNAIAIAAREHSHGRLIDIGCGAKPYRRLFAPYVTEHVGVDHSELQHDAGAVDVLASAYEIPVESSSFDTVLMSEVLEHLEQPTRALSEAHRLLKPGGWLILTTPFIWVLHEAPRDFSRYSPFGLKWLLSETGFESVEVTPLGGQWSTVALMTSYALSATRRRWRAFGWPVARLVQHVGWRLDRRNFRPWMSWNHLAVAQKPTD